MLDVIKKYQENRKAGLCPFCSKDMKLETNKVFRDALSLKEFEISGLCQRCQDKTFQPEYVMPDGS